MKKYLKAAMVMAVFSFFSLACTQNQQASLAQSGALDITFTDLNRKTVSLASFRDKHPVVLFFWTTWCPYCRREIRALNEKYAALKKEGWEILTVDSGEGAHKVEAYANANGIKLNLYLDEDMAISDALGVLGVPTYVIIDKKGSIIAKTHTFSPEEYQQLTGDGSS
jgi:peroxiredoxin